MSRIALAVLLLAVGATVASRAVPPAQAADNPLLPPGAADRIATEGTGTSLLDRCHSQDKVLGHPGSDDPLDLLNAGYCLGFVKGIADIMEILPLSGAPDSANGLLGSCYRHEAASDGRIVTIVKRYLEDPATDLRKSASSLVVDAIKQAFPCTGKAP